MVMWCAELSVYEKSIVAAREDKGIHERSPVLRVNSEKQAEECRERDRRTSVFDTQGKRCVMFPQAICFAVIPSAVIIS